MALWKEKVLVGVVLGATMLPGYYVLAARAVRVGGATPAWVVTDLDRSLPLVPEAIWVYLSWYPAVAVLGFAGRPTLRRGYVAYAASFAVCSIGHFLLPWRMERPLLGAPAGLAAWLLVACYGWDPPVNLFPSFHAALAGVLLRLRPAAPVRRAGVVLWVLLLCASCVLTKQHYVLDVVAGLAAGVTVSRLTDVLLGHQAGVRRHWAEEPRLPREPARIATLTGSLRTGQRKPPAPGPTAGPPAGGLRH